MIRLMEENELEMVCLWSVFQLMTFWEVAFILLFDLSVGVSRL